jgi:CheY-like chemotaxis protein
MMRRRIHKGDHEISDLLNEAEKASERSITLTQRLLAFSRQQALAPVTIECNRLIRDMSDLLRATLGEHIIIETVLGAGLWKAYADPNELEHAILNISINARDAMPEGGKLTIETANAHLDEEYCTQHSEIAPGQFVMIAISDTGAGMTQKVLARVFDPFYTTKSVGKGTGLGLSQVYGFVKQSNGHVKIYSEVGVGTAVKIYLPRHQGPAKEARSPVVQQAVEGGGGQCVLVVEDEPLMLQVTTKTLRELGYMVHSSSSGSEALQILEDTPQVQLLLTDVVMPEMNGKQLADEALKRRPNLKIIFTTGYTSNAVVHGGVLDANVNFLSKPFTLEQLQSKLRNVLEQ